LEKAIDEYLNHALNLSLHSGRLPQTKHDVRHKTASFNITRFEID